MRNDTSCKKEYLQQLHPALHPTAHVHAGGSARLGMQLFGRRAPVELFLSMAPKRTDAPDD